MKTEQKNKLKAVTGMTDIPFVSEGIAAEASGFLISEDGLTRIAEALQAGDAATTQAATLQGAVTTAQAAKETAEAALVTANATITTNTTRITELEARVAELEAEPVVTATTKDVDATAKGKVPYHLSAENPMNKIADGLFGVPVEKMDNKN